ncbi:hypothetical protein [Streptacidiphilus neutrinimicus]|uniref:hypothetical protein n=1 Tax=Streptacidiphilus neutrinimicus TaxID=105420 RepID=UPI000694B2BB|nr:hypothetical protein [Streptacidiphilus neutrinimicus]
MDAATRSQLHEAGFRARWIFPNVYELPDDMPPAEQRQVARDLYEHLRTRGVSADLDQALTTELPADPPELTAADRSGTTVRIDYLPDDAWITYAHIEGPDQALAGAVLAGAGFRQTETGWTLARIDGEAEHYSSRAVTALRTAGITVHAHAEFDPDQGYADQTQWVQHPMPWLDREEVLEVGRQAQEIFEDIATGRLVLHAHAHDGHTTVAVGSYSPGQSVHLHGEDYYRTESLSFSTADEALSDFTTTYGAAVVAGPPPLTPAERRVLAALGRSPLAQLPVAPPAPTPPHVSTQPSTTQPGHGR